MNDKLNINPDENAEEISPPVIELTKQDVGNKQAAIQNSHPVPETLNSNLENTQLRETESKRIRRM